MNERRTEHGSIWDFLFPLDGPGTVDHRKLNTNFARLFPTQRAVRDLRETRVRPTDYVLLLDLDFPAVIDLPPFFERHGKPLRFVDAGRKTSRHPIRIRPYRDHTGRFDRDDHFINWPDAEITLNSDGEVITIWPVWNSPFRGWFVELDPGGGALVQDEPPGQPTTGMLWFDRRIGQLFVYAGPDIGWIAANCCDGQGAAIVSPDQPQDPADGALWWDRRIGQLFVNVPGVGWVAANCCDGGIPVSIERPREPFPGMLWFSPVTGRLMVFTGAEWVEIGGTQEFPGIEPDRVVGNVSGKFERARPLRPRQLTELVNRFTVRRSGAVPAPFGFIDAPVVLSPRGWELIPPYFGAQLIDAPDDDTASQNGVPAGGVYRNGSVLMINQVASGAVNFIGETDMRVEGFAYRALGTVNFRGAARTYTAGFAYPTLGTIGFTGEATMHMRGFAHPALSAATVNAQGTMTITGAAT